MAGIQKFSAHVIDYAERLSGMADVAEGKHPQKTGRATRWLLLPASGAALYALVKSDSFSRQAKGVVDEAKSRASELPEDLLTRVRQTAGGSSSQSSSQNGSTQSRPATTRKRSSARKTSSARRTKASAR
jgi:hypothetical protein